MVAVLLGSTAYDSFANTSWWIQTVQNSDVITIVWGTGGLLTMITIVLVTFARPRPGWPGTGGSRRPRPTRG